MKRGDDGAALHPSNSRYVKNAVAVRTGERAVSRDVFRLARVCHDLDLALESMSAGDAPQKHAVASLTRCERSFVHRQPRFYAASLAPSAFLRFSSARSFALAPG